VGIFLKIRGVFMTTPLSQRIQKAIIDVPDFPQPGIIFKDLCPILRDPSLMKDIIHALAQQAKAREATVIAGMESRGFFYALPVALELGLPFVPVRKPGKLPGKVFQESYDLEYGKNTLEIQQSAFTPSDRVFLIDDLLATGGTAQATYNLVSKQSRAQVCGFGFVVELDFLKGRSVLNFESAPLTSLFIS
jgi:adenine phosphoribosyltransferase